MLVHFIALDNLRFVRNEFLYEKIGDYCGFSLVVKMRDLASAFLKDTESVIIDGMQQDDECEPLSKHCSSECLIIPAQPTLFRIFQFAHFTSRSVNEFEYNIAYDILRFHLHRYPSLLEKIISNNVIDGLTSH